MKLLVMSITLSLLAGCGADRGTAAQEPAGSGTAEGPDASTSGGRPQGESPIIERSGS
jgi:hypothetical protein